MGVGGIGVSVGSGVLVSVTVTVAVDPGVAVSVTAVVGVSVGSGVAGVGLAVANSACTSETSPVVKRRLRIDSRRKRGPDREIAERRRNHAERVSKVEGSGRRIHAWIDEVRVDSIFLAVRNEADVRWDVLRELKTIDRSRTLLTRGIAQGVSSSAVTEHRVVRVRDRSKHGKIGGRNETEVECPLQDHVLSRHRGSNNAGGDVDICTARQTDWIDLRLHLLHRVGTGGAGSRLAER